MARYKLNLSTMQRLATRVLVNPNGCWEWAGLKTEQGYGKADIDKKSKRTHRAVYEYCIDDIPEGYELHHLCENRACLNPSHLVPLTSVHHKMMTIHSIGTRFNATKTHCPKGHEYTEENTRRAMVGNSMGRFCRACARLASKKRYKENRKEIQQQRRERYATDAVFREQTREWNRQYYRRNELMSN